ncbi:L,D-transpeptidase family protein [Qipengyuania sp. RANM35]|uniref:L,D-transpeptidase family protein n=1 Tax=Qipengyuania sp. RANM35 TaxID=3068635 RepID=UPI0034DB1AAA
MDANLKWIGGATLVVAAVLGGVALTGAGDPADATPSAAANQPKLEPMGAIAAKAQADYDRLYTVRRILPIEGPIKYGEWYWDDKDVPPGPLLVTVDLQARVISVFQGGYEIGAAAVMLGTDDHPTPTGHFPILYKDRHNVSEKYGNAPMPWSLFLTTDGVAIHGGHLVENGYASHGCVGVPDEIASRLFAIAKKGDMVVITDGKTMGLGDSII